MNFGHFTYLVTVLVFAGTAVIIELIFKRRVLKKYKLVIGSIALGSILFSIVGDWAATQWNAWLFPADKNLGIRIFGTTLESLIYGVLISIAIASATLLLSRYEEKKK